MSGPRLFGFSNLVMLAFLVLAVLAGRSWARHDTADAVFAVTICVIGTAGLLYAARNEGVQDWTRRHDR